MPRSVSGNSRTTVRTDSNTRSAPTYTGSSTTRFTGIEQRVREQEQRLLRTV